MSCSICGGKDHNRRSCTLPQRQETGCKACGEQENLAEYQTTGARRGGQSFVLCDRCAGEAAGIGGLARVREISAVPATEAAR